MQNLWDTAKAVLRGKFIAIYAYLKYIEKISNKQPHLSSKRTRGPTTKPRVSRRMEIIKIIAELNDRETKKTVQRINESRGWFLTNR